MKLSRTLAPVTVLLLSVQLEAQEERWSVVRVSGDMLAECTLDSTFKTSLMVRCGDSPLLIPADSIVMVYRKGGAAFWTGVKTGGTIGGAAGAIVGIGRGIGLVSNANLNTVDEWGTVGALGTGFKVFTETVAIAVVGCFGGALIGGVIGSATGRSNSYELRNDSLEDRIQKLGSLAVCKEPKGVQPQR